jgi:hypothetical protein
MATIEKIYGQQTDEAEVIELFLSRFSVDKSDSQGDLLKKITEIDSTTQHFKQDFNRLKDKAEKHQYIRFMSKLTEMREALQLATAQISMQDIQLASRSFAKKTQYPIGVF